MLPLFREMEKGVAGRGGGGVGDERRHGGATSWPENGLVGGAAAGARLMDDSSLELFVTNTANQVDINDNNKTKI